MTEEDHSFVGIVKQVLLKSRMRLEGEVGGGVGLNEVGAGVERDARRHQPKS